MGLSPTFGGFFICGMMGRFGDGGRGERSCIGKNLSLFIMNFILNKRASEYSILLNNGGLSYTAHRKVKPSEMVTGSLKRIK
jgi:hypothetical protein